MGTLRLSPGVRSTWSHLHAIAYRIWLVLLAARLAVVAAALFLLLADAIISRAQAAAKDDGSIAPSDPEAGLQAILNYDAAAVVLSDRRTCVAGHQPDAIRQERGKGWSSLPDAAETCVAVATRMARDGVLLQPYQELLASLGSGVAGYDALPAAIAAAVLKTKSDRIPIGNGKAAIITPAWAFDAGLTVAYQQKPKPPARLPDLATVKPVAERCLAQQEADLGLCYSTGYLYGMRAVNGLSITAAR